jgi:hypothetical protein
MRDGLKGIGAFDGRVGNRLLGQDAHKLNTGRGGQFPGKVRDLADDTVVIVVVVVIAVVIPILSVIDVGFESDGERGDRNHMLRAMVMCGSRNNIDREVCDQRSKGQNM